MHPRQIVGIVRSAVFLCDDVLDVEIFGFHRRVGKAAVFAPSADTPAGGLPLRGGHAGPDCLR